MILLTRDQDGEKKVNQHEFYPTEEKDSENNIISIAEAYAPESTSTPEKPFISAKNKLAEYILT